MIDKVLLADYIKIIEAGTRPSGGVDLESGDIPSLGGENILQSGGVKYNPVKKIQNSFFKTMNRGKLQNNDVLINKDGANTGKVGLFKFKEYGKAAINEHLFLIRGDEALDNTFLFYLLLSEGGQIQIKRQITGSAQPGLNSNFINYFSFNLPPVPQQKKVAKILSTCDAVIEKTEAAIAKYKAIKQGMMNDLFTRGIDLTTGKLRPTPEQAPDLYIDSELGKIPKDWEVEDLESFATIFYGKDYKSNPKGDSIPIYGTGGIMGYTSLKLNSGPVVLTGRKGSINNPLYVEGDFWNVDTIFCIKTDEQTNVKWFFNQLKNKDLTKINEATGVPSVSSSALNRLKFSTPDLVEQNEIEKRVSSIETKIQIEKDNLLKHQKIKSGLMQDLLTGKVKVKVEPEKIA